MINRTLVAGAFLWCAGTQAQQVICSSGTQVVQNGLGSITYTIGEPVFTTNGDATTVLTQGFEQPWADVSTDATDGVTEDEGISVFPNPTRHILHVMFKGERRHDGYELSDAQGRVLERGRLNDQDNTMDMSTYAAGQYLLRITGRDTRTFRIHTTR